MKTDVANVSFLAIERRHHRRFRRRAPSRWFLTAAAAVVAVRQTKWTANLRIRRSTQKLAPAVGFLELAQPARQTTWGVGESAVQWWWSELSPAQRTQVRDLAPGELLPDAFVVSLLLYGVELDTMSDPTRVPQPLALQGLLYGERQQQQQKQTPVHLVPASCLPTDDSTPRSVRDALG